MAASTPRPPRTLITVANLDHERDVITVSAGDQRDVFVPVRRLGSPAGAVIGNRLRGVMPMPVPQRPDKPVDDLQSPHHHRARITERVRSDLQVAVQHEQTGRSPGARPASGYAAVIGGKRSHGGDRPDRRYAGSRGRRMRDRGTTGFRSRSDGLARAL